MRDPRTRARGLALGLCAAAIAAVMQVQPASAQDAKQASVKPQTTSRGIYYVDFRARTAASYGHAFVWYGRTDQKQIEVAGLHPASESVIPYIIGHLLPVPSETGKSYGDLDDDYLTASYRVYMTEAEAQRVFAYIKRLQATSPLWNAATYNCVAFIQDIARYMVNRLRELNGGRRYTSSPAAAQASSGKPSASGQKPAAPAYASASY